VPKQEDKLKREILDANSPKIWDIGGKKSQDLGNWRQKVPRFGKCTRHGNIVLALYRYF
jgi:hypothetical protein